MIDIDMTVGYKKIQQLLKAYNVELKETDESLIFMLVEEVEEEIKNFCNIKLVPQELHTVVVRRVCGHFLDIKGWSTKDLSQNESQENYGEVKAMTLGDYRMEVDTGIDKEKIKIKAKEVESLKKYGNEMLYKYRRLVTW